MLKKISLIIILFILTNIPTNASNNLYIYATVNEKIITNFDIKKEIEYLKILNPSLSRLKEKEIFELGKNSLINEIVKKNEIKKFIDFEKENPMVNKYLENLYKNLNFNDEKSFENSLQGKDIYSLAEIKDKLKIEVLWNELIYIKYSNQVKIDKKIFLKKIDKIKNNQINDYLLSEIVFKKNKNENLNLTIKKIENSISEIGFNNTANILSISDSSKRGGNIGWISEQNLSEIILKNLTNINEGQHTNIIQINNNFLILKIEKIRVNTVAIDKEKELEKMIAFETDKQLNQFSRIYFDKAKINYSINEK